MNFKKLITLFILQFVVIPLFAQSTDTGNWLVYFGNQAFNKKWNLHSEVQYRSYNFIGDTQQLLFRTGLGYNFNEKNNNLLLGYGFINTHNYVANTDEKVDFDEHRIFQQFITRQGFGRIFTQHRYRTEQRFYNEIFSFRFRYFLSLNIPINQKTMAPQAVYLSMSDELFINAKANVFDRNRLYGGLGYVINKNLRVELGYMSQMLENSRRGQMQILLFNNIPFQKN
jgi:hypothetical protein